MCNSSQECQQYLKTNEYQQVLEAEAETARQQKRPKIGMGSQKVVIEALTTFAKQKWPCSIDELIFSNSLREQIAKAAVQIKNIKNLYKKLNLTYNLATSSWRAYAEDIVSIIQLTIAPTLQDFIQLRPQNDKGLSDSAKHVNKIRPSQAMQSQEKSQRPTMKRQKRRRKSKKSIINVGGGELIDWTARSK